MAHVVWGNVEDNTSSSASSQLERRHNVDFQKISTSSSDRTNEGGPLIPQQDGALDRGLTRRAQKAAMSLAGAYLGDGDDGRGSASGANDVPLSGGTEGQTWMAGILESTLRSRDGLWSRGSAQHVTGNCKACHYIHTTRGCANGADCKFCHIPHTGVDRSKVCVSKRDHCNEIANVLAARFESDPDTFRQVAVVVAHRSAFLQQVLDQRIAGGSAPTPSSSSGQPGGMLPGEQPKRPGKKHVMSL
eukprot:CAMPEP_0176070926 /NCGR_PEP_ID=MMETSP0120_2-20121206/35423_1 /TAXON_ID=160619 /ORGANISM="Kryptoperidinium foliaceum, Strain CCMP 1326" /LENGTH=245 /DNA_ID=CAMNT_0017404579 /DNA_START=63 /DNA_END=800 /DNA_ORIENTATION=+